MFNSSGKLQPLRRKLRQEAGLMKASLLHQVGVAQHEGGVEEHEPVPRDVDSIRYTIYGLYGRKSSIQYTDFFLHIIRTPRRT